MQVLEYNIAFIYKSAIYLQIVIRRSVLLLVFHMIGNRITVLACGICDDDDEDVEC